MLKWRGRAVPAKGHALQGTRETDGDGQAVTACITARHDLDATVSPRRAPASIVSASGERSEVTGTLGNKHSSWVRQPDLRF
jgi:hypothetical protein